MSETYFVEQRGEHGQRRDPSTGEGGLHGALQDGWLQGQGPPCNQKVKVGQELCLIFISSVTFFKIIHISDLKT